MLGNLLIIRKNGRGVKTYGVKELVTYNMKIIFFCIVTLLSCSVRANEDVDIYPGLNFREISEEQQRNLKSQDESLYPSSYLESSRWQPDLPFPGVPVNDYNDIRKPERDLVYNTIPERLRQLEEIVNRRRSELKRDRDKIPYYNYNRNRVAQPEELYEAYKNFQNGDRQLDRYQLRFPNQQILDDVRPYPHDDDFSFHDDDEEDEIISENERSVGRKTEEASGKGALDYGKHTDEEVQFAYPPSDPRYYEYTPITEVKTQQQIDAEYTETNGANDFSDDEDEDKIHLKQRNDEKFSNQQNEIVDDTEHRTDNAVEVVAVRPHFQGKDSAGVYIIAVVAGISAAATVGLIAFGIGWYNLQKHVKNASDVEYPAYGVTGPNKDVSPSGDRRLAQSAQMYHYQHQKQQIIAMESRATATDRHGSLSEADSDEENEEGDYTVYECPGLAPTGEMEVKNPLFQDDPTPAQTPAVKPNGENVQTK